MAFGSMRTLSSFFFARTGGSGSRSPELKERRAAEPDLGMRQTEQRAAPDLHIKSIYLIDINERKS
jgi:hypothetical protein